MTTHRNWILLVTLLALALLAVHCAAPAAAPQPSEPTAGPAALPELSISTPTAPRPADPVLPTDMPVLPIPTDPGPAKPGLNLEAVLEAHPLPDGYQDLPVDMDGAIGYAYGDGRLGLVLAPLTFIDPDYQHPDEADLGMPIGVAWRPNPMFEGTYVITVDVSSVWEEDAQGSLIGNAMSDNMDVASLPIRFAESFLDPTGSLSDLSSLSPVAVTLRAYGSCFRFQEDDVLPLARICSNGKSSLLLEESLLEPMNPVDPEGARDYLIEQIISTTDRLKEEKYLPSGAEVAADQVIGDIENPETIQACDPVNYDPPCATDLIAAPVLPPDSSSGRAGGLARTWDQLPANSQVPLGIVVVVEDLPGVLVDSTDPLSAGGYVVHAMTDDQGELLLPALVSGVPNDGPEILNQPVASEEVPLVDSQEDAGIAEIAQCKLWKICLFFERCRRR